MLGHGVIYTGKLLLKMLVIFQERKHGQRLNIIVLAEGAVDHDGNVITAESLKEVMPVLLKSNHSIFHVLFSPVFVL